MFYHDLNTSGYPFFLIMYPYIQNLRYGIDLGIIYIYFRLYSALNLFE